MIALRLATDVHYTPRYHRPFYASPSHQECLSGSRPLPSRITSELTARSLRLSSLQLYDSRLLYEYRMLMWRTVLVHYVSPRMLEYRLTLFALLPLATQDIAYNMLWFHLPYVSVENERRPNFIFVCTQQMIRFTPANALGYSICSTVCMPASPCIPIYVLVPAGCIATCTVFAQGFRPALSDTLTSDRDRPASELWELFFTAVTDPGVVPITRGYFATKAPA